MHIYIIVYESAYCFNLKIIVKLIEQIMMYGVRTKFETNDIIYFKKDYQHRDMK
jgi:hypothetical protein